ncbi:MAG: hypothetical protein RLZ04_84 [Actinomycetota bacterium]
MFVGLTSFAQAALEVHDNVAFPIVGLVAGLAIGLTGMGGGVLLTPIMVLLMGVPANAAVSNDLIISLVIKPIGAATHHKAGNVRRDIVKWLVIGSVPAAFAGALLMNLVLDDDADALETLIGVTLLTASVMMIVRMVRRPDGIVEEPPVRPLLTLCVGLVGGILVGLTSVGSGSLMLVLLTWVYPHLSGRTLVGTDLAQAIPLVGSAALGHLLFGDVRLEILIPVILGAAPGVWLGSRWSTRLPDKALRPILIVLVTLSGLKLTGIV